MIHVRHSSLSSGPSWLSPASIPVAQLGTNSHSLVWTSSPYSTCWFLRLEISASHCLWELLLPVFVTSTYLIHHRRLQRAIPVFTYFLWCMSQHQPADPAPIVQLRVLSHTSHLYWISFPFGHDLQPMTIAQGSRILVKRVQLKLNYPKTLVWFHVALFSPWWLVNHPRWLFFFTKCKNAAFKVRVNWLLMVLHMDHEWADSGRIMVGEIPNNFMRRSMRKADVPPVCPGLQAVAHGKTKQNCNTNISKSISISLTLQQYVLSLPWYIQSSFHHSEL